MVGLPNKSNGTQYKSGQASGTPAEFFIGAQNEGVGYFARRAHYDG